MKPKVEPIFQEWLKQEFPLALPTGNHLRQLRLAFYTGAWMALGYIQKLDQMPEIRATEFISDMTQEVKMVVKYKL